MRTTRQGARDRSRFTALLLLGLGCVAGAPWAAAQQPAASMNIKTDGSALAKAAAAAIQADPTLVEPASVKLSLSAQGGVIHISGAVGTLYDREQVIRDAEGCSGATGVRPSVTVKRAAKADPSALKEAVLQAVRKANVAGPVLDATVDAEGTVQLNGQVTDEWRAVDAVKRVPGVTAIAGYKARDGGLSKAGQTRLEVVVPEASTDAQLAQQVQRSLAEAGLAAVSSSVKQGVVTLKGRAEALAAMFQAARLAREVPGVLGIRSEVQVRTGMFRAGELRDGQVVAREVRSSISQARVGRIRDLGVHVTGGSVTITGRASSAEAANAATEAATSVPGVHEVVNALTYPWFVQGS